MTNHGKAARLIVSPGFTLVELLVVMAIIGILIAILLPALSRVRGQSQQLVCAANLRSWGQAFAIYAINNRGVIPHSGDETRNPLATFGKYDPKRPQNECSYLDTLPLLMGRPAWKSYPLGQKPTGDIWQCPLAIVLPDSAYAYSASQVGYHSYVMNHYLDDDIQSAVLPLYPSFLNLAKAKSASKTLLMFESTLNPNNANGQGGITGACFLGCYPDDTPAALGDRHPHARGKLGGNLMMLDGHVEWTDHLWDPALNHPEVPPITDRRWFPY